MCLQGKMNLIFFVAINVCLLENVKELVQVNVVMVTNKRRWSANYFKYNNFILFIQSLQQIPIYSITVHKSI